jgi:alkylation response protein AidB-like acyl-CoA dehydrogenase
MSKAQTKQTKTERKQMAAAEEFTAQEREEQERMVLDSVDRFLERDVAPYAHDLEADDVYPREIVDKMVEMGIFGATIPAEYGGLGLGASTYAKIVERVSTVWMSVSGIFNSHLIMAAAVSRGGTEEQKAKWLPRFASGELRGGIALTEPDAGTDLQGIRTRADKSGNGYALTGAKAWISNSVEGGVLAILAKTDPEAEPRHKGMSLFLVEKSEEFQVTKKMKKLGYKGIDTGEFVMDELFVPGENLVGGVEGRGLQQILGGLELGRINVAARGIGIARACLLKSVEYAQVRKTFGKPICEHQSIQIKLADMATNVESARLLTEQAARAYDRGERCDMEAGMAKLVASEAALSNSLEAMRLHGAYGYSKEFDIERYYRDAPLLAIGEGTNELQKLIIARQLIARHPV